MTSENIGTGNIEGEGIAAGRGASANTHHGGSTVYNNYQAPPQLVNPDRLTNDEVLRALYDRIVGNSIRGVPGLISTVENMAQSIAKIQKDHESLYKDVQSQKSSNEAKFSTQSMWIWLALGILGLEGVAILIIVMLRI